MHCRVEVVQCGVVLSALLNTVISRGEWKENNDMAMHTILF